MMRNVIVFIFIFALAPLMAETEKKDSGRRSYKFFKDNETFIKKPFELRDPFKRKRVKKAGVKKSYGRLLVDDRFDNLPDISNTPLEFIRVTGLLLGKDRRAIARVLNGNQLSAQTYILREGMRIGENNAEIKAILPGGIVLVEKIRNVYDQDEYIETVIPVSSDI